MFEIKILSSKLCHNKLKIDEEDKEQLTLVILKYSLVRILGISFILHFFSVFVEIFREYIFKNIVGNHSILCKQFTTQVALNINWFTIISTLSFKAILIITISVLISGANKIGTKKLCQRMW